MTYYTKVGTFKSPAAAGSVAVTGIGFKPLALIIWGIGANATGWGTESILGIGFAAGTTGAYTSGYICTAGHTAVGTTVEGRRISAGAIGIITPSGTLAEEATLTSMDTGGFTLNFGTVDTLQLNYYYMAIGGTDVTNAEVVSWAARSGTGDQTVATTGSFQPSMVFHIGTGDSTALPHTTTHSAAYFGAMEGTNQFATYHYAQSAVTTSNTGRMQMTDGCIVGGGLGTGVATKATFKQWETNGFTVTWGTNDTAVRRFLSLCIKGGAYTAGHFSKSTSTTYPPIDAATLGFTPTGMLSITDSYTASGSGQTGERHSIGASDKKYFSSCAVTNKHGATTTYTRRVDDLGFSIFIADNDAQATDTAATLIDLGYCSTGSVLTPTLASDCEGLAFDGTYYYETTRGTSDGTGTAIYKYDTSWNLVASNTTAGTAAGVNDLCGCDIYGNKLYVACQNTDIEGDPAQRIALFNKDTLAFIENHDISAYCTGYSPDASGLGIDPTNRIIYVSSFGSGLIYTFNLDTFAYIRTITPNPVLNTNNIGFCMQDVSWYRGSLYVSYSPVTAGPTVQPGGGVMKMNIDGTNQDYSAVPLFGTSTTYDTEPEGVFVNDDGIHLIINFATPGTAIVYTFSWDDGFGIWYNKNSSTATQICYVACGPVETNAAITGVAAAATAAGRAPAMHTGIGISAVKAAATAAGRAPGLISNNTLAAARAQATATANAPNISGGAGVTAVKATATATGRAPTLSTASVMAAARAIANSTAPVPGLISNNTLAAVKAAATATVVVPVVSGGAGVSAVTAQATATGVTPALTSNNVLAAVKAAATAAGIAPTIISNNTLTAVRAQATATGIVPVVGGSAGVTAVRAQATAAANAPALTSNNVLAAVVAAATATANVPTLTSNNVLAVVVAAATATANAPALSTASVLAAVQAAATATANAPTLSTASVLAAVAATATATGRAPTLTSNNVLAAVKAVATATAIAPVVSGNAAVAAVVAHATAAAIAPTVATVMDALINAVAAVATATARAPTIGGNVWADVFIDATTAMAIADAVAPEITEYQGIEIGAAVAAATAVAVIPEIYGQIVNVPYCEPEVDFDGAEILIDILGGIYADITAIIAQEAGTSTFGGSYPDAVEFDASETVETIFGATYDDNTKFVGILPSTQLVGFIRCKT